jgi:hypothetical protein
MRRIESGTGSLSEASSGIWNATPGIPGRVARKTNTITGRIRFIGERSRQKRKKKRGHPATGWPLSLPLSTG